MSNNVNPQYPKSNQGFLFEVNDPAKDGNHLHILSTEGHIWENPVENNSKVREVFSEAQVVYFDQQSLSEKSAEILVSRTLEVFQASDTELNHNFLSQIQEYSSALLSAVELSPIASAVYEGYHNIEEERNLAQDVFVHFMILMIHQYELSNPKKDNTFETYLKETGLEFRYIQSEEDILDGIISVFKVFEKLLHNRHGIVLLKQLFVSESVRNGLFDEQSLKTNAWHQGDVKTHDENFRFESSVVELLEKDAEWMSEEEKEKSLKELQELEGLLQDFAAKKRQSTTDKIPKILKEGKRAFVVISSSSEASKENGIVQAVSRQGLKIQQITVPMKPVGFFWKMKNNEGHKAYLLGTMHMTPDDLLCLNSKILRCFGKSAVVGVEVDITRPDVVEAVKKHPLIVKESEEERKYFDSLGEKNQSLLLTALQLLFLKNPELDALLKKKEENMEEKESESNYTKFLRHKEVLIQEVKSAHGFISGVELDLIPKAKEAGKPVIDLETVEGQLGEADAEAVRTANFDGILPMLLSPILENMDGGAEVAVQKLQEGFEAVKQTYKERMDGIAHLVKHGYTEKLKRFSSEMPASEKRHFNKRNFTMASRIDDLVQGNPDKRHFFMVGAAHFPGDYGLIKLLEGLGYTTVRIMHEEPF